MSVDDKGNAIRVTADPEIMQRLARVLNPEATEALTQEQADAALARIVWSRLAEPSDAVAGALIALVGAGAALELITSQGGARLLHSDQHAVDPNLSERSVREGMRRWLPRLNRAATLSDLDCAIAHGMSLVMPGSAHWPDRLNDLGEHAPIMLWVLGDPTALARFSLAVVGARACTGYGSHVTAELTDAVCSAGVSVVSGAAYGVDAVAHRTALASETTTVAVIACGVDRPYPAAHTELLRRIAAGGAVCSEMVPGSAPTRWRFLMRNRLIAALAQGTLVTEAGARSGSLNTAGHACEIGRPLGAVPGPVTSAGSMGCHRLIRDYGATLITNGTELREFLGLTETLLDAAAQNESREDSADGARRQPSMHQRVIDALPLRGTRSTRKVAQVAGLSAEDAQGALAELELLGFVERATSSGEAPPTWRLLRRQ